MNAAHTAALPRLARVTVCLLAPVALLFQFLRLMRQAGETTQKMPPASLSLFLASLCSLGAVLSCCVAAVLTWRRPVVFVVVVRSAAVGVGGG